MKTSIKKATAEGGQSKAYWKMIKLNYSNKSSTGVPTLIDSETNFIDDKSKVCLLKE